MAFKCCNIRILPIRDVCVVSPVSRNLVSGCYPIRGWVKQWRIETYWRGGLPKCVVGVRMSVQIYPFTHLGVGDQHLFMVYVVVSYLRPSACGVASVT